MQMFKLQTNIADNDYQRIIRKIQEFLEKDRKQVKVSVLLHGRQKGKPEMGLALLERVIQDTAEYSMINHMPTTSNLNLVIGPKKKS